MLSLCDVALRLKLQCSPPDRAQIIPLQIRVYGVGSYVAAFNESNILLESCPM